MADVQECIVKMVATGTISKAVADEALEMFRRSKAEYSRDLGPASADAAAALEAAKKLRDRAAERQISIAASVKTWGTMEQRIVADPRGGLVSLTAMSSKDTALGDNLLNDLRKTQPDHPIFEGKNVGSLTDVLHRSFYNSLGEAMEKFRPGFLKNAAEIVRSAGNFIDERFGVSTGDIAAKTVSDAFGDVVGKAQDRAILAGKVFEPSEDWRVPQPWTPRRVAAVSEQFFVDRFKKWIDAGGLKLWDKEKNTPAALADHDHILKRAYADIKYEGGTTEPECRQAQIQRRLRSIPRRAI
jgi:hypothetical protein